MKFLFYSLILASIFVGCKSQYATIDPSTIKNDNNQLSIDVEDVKTPTKEEETITVQQQTAKGDEKVVIRQEEVVLTQGSAIMQYCVIVGSFINEGYAVNLRTSLIQKGYRESNIMQNRQGMYRVSIGCSDNETNARSLLSKIRSTYSEFKDAWLLKTK